MIKIPIKVENIIIYKLSDAHENMELHGVNQYSTTYPFTTSVNNQTPHNTCRSKIFKINNLVIEINN